MTKLLRSLLVVGAATVAVPHHALAQQAQTTPPAAQPAAAQPLPEVDVQQQPAKPKPKPKVAAQKKKPAPVVVADPVPEEPPAAPVAEALPPGPGERSQLSTGIKMSPVAGSEIPLEKVPSGVSSISAADIKRDGGVIAQDTLQSRVPGVIIGDLQGNQFQTNVQYRGFESSPVNGVPQGLAVYQNGVRINESFGDTVNWDFLPSNAISDITVISGNPVFGLNAIGGAISLTMKDGFNYQGGEIDTRFGSFGRKQVSVDAGMSSGAVSAYVAAEGIDDEGFRDFSNAEVRRIYADLGFRGDGAEFHVNFTGGDNYVGVTAAAPEELLAVSRERTFTGPQTTDNNVEMVSLNGVVKATDALTFSGVTYFRSFRQRHDDGNIAEIEECDDPGQTGTVCIEDGQATGTGPGTNPDGTIPFDDDLAYGSIDRTGQRANSYGGSLQAVNKSDLFGLNNQFLVGTSYDHGRVGYTANSELGTFLPRFVVDGTGIFFDGPNDVAPRDLTTTNDYFGLYFSNTLDLTRALSLTVGGRYNYARIEIEENTGNPALADLNGVNTFERFNPMAGLTYKVLPGLSVYGGYSEANRAPTPAEIACSDPENPCIIESFLTADPPLEQVVSRTWETGLRGESTSFTGRESFTWSAGLFRTENTNDIINISDPQQGRGYFDNAGDTLRQGFEASVAYRAQRFFAYANYSFIDATFQTALLLPSPNNPAAFDCPSAMPADEPITCVNVDPGDRLPGVPRHRLKVGFDYKLTPEWTFGADLIAASDQVFFGDEGNDDKPLSGYTKINLHSSYDVTKNFQIYGLIENLTDAEYGIYGTYFNLNPGNVGASADPGLPKDANGNFFTGDNLRTITPVIPFAAYGGVKYKF